MGNIIRSAESKWTGNVIKTFFSELKRYKASEFLEEFRKKKTLFYLIEFDRWNLKSKYNDPDKSQDQGSVTVYDILRTNHFHLYLLINKYLFSMKLLTSSSLNETSVEQTGVEEGILSFLRKQILHNYFICPYIWELPCSSPSSHMHQKWNLGNIWQRDGSLKDLKFNYWFWKLWLSKETQLSDTVLQRSGSWANSVIIWCDL